MVWSEWVWFIHLLGIGAAFGCALAQAQLVRDAGKGGDDALFFVVAARSIRIKVESPSIVVFATATLVKTFVVDSPSNRYWAPWSGFLVLFLVYIAIHALCGRKLRHLHRLFVEAEHPAPSKPARKEAQRLSWLLTVGQGLPAVSLLMLSCDPGRSWAAGP